MTTTLTALSETITFSGSGSYAGAANAAGGVPGGSIPLGSGSWAAMTTAYTYGTGTGQVNQVYIAQRTLATVTLDTISLSGSLLSPVGDTIAFTKLKFCAISIISPDGTKRLRVGPQGGANAFIGPWTGGQTAVVYKMMTAYEIIVNEPVAGYTVTPATAMNFFVYNEALTSVIYNIIFLGIG